MPNPFTAPAPPERISPPSGRAKSYLRDLMRDAALAKGHNVAEAGINIDTWIDADHRTAKQVSDEIDRLKAEGHTGWKHKDAAKQAVAPSATPELEDGFYRLGTDVIKVIHSQEGNQYGSKLMVLSEMVRLDDDTVRAADFDWVYLGQNVLRQPLVKMTPEEAQAFGQLYGRCGICGRTLRRKLSIDRGIGPDCWAKHGFE